MSGLLTWNGIPPHTIGSLTPGQRHAVVTYGAIDRKETYPDWQNTEAMPPAIQPFARTVASVVQSFTAWGATVINNREYNKIGFFSSFVNVGETTFSKDFQTHSDAGDALIRLEQENRLSIRLLSVSSRPAEFIDLTEQENMSSVLSEHQGRAHFYKPTLLTLAQKEGQTIQPKCWDNIVFDALTPHDPKGAAEANQRQLLDAWIDLQLPSYWRHLVRSGVLPRLKLTQLTS